MCEFQAVGMEKVPAEIAHRDPELLIREIERAVAAIEDVTDDRVPFARQMDADLVCPAGFNADAEERKGSACAFFVVVGDRFAFAT